MNPLFFSHRIYVKYLYIDKILGFHVNLQYFEFLLWGDDIL